MTWIWDHLALVAFLALGFAALWQLLQPARRQRLGAAIGAGVLAFILGGWTLIYAGGAGAVEPGVLFYLFAGTAVLAAASMITQRNPVYAALWFALVIISVCGLFLLQAAAFLAAATIIVYAGAIIVTFLFVIMLAQQSGYAAYDRIAREPLLATLAGFLLLGALLDILQKTYSAPAVNSQIVERLIHVRHLLEAKATDKQIDDAMYLGESIPLTRLLEEEIKRVPRDVWLVSKKAHVEERFKAGLENWTAGKTGPGGRDSARMDAAITTWQEIARELQRDSPHPSTLPIPDRIRAELAVSGAAPARVDSAQPTVAGLGRALFGQYLYAVELAGALLLIATIGAIAIVQRPQPAKEAGV
jgi:NADH-quinone oxidoreductase subunit J